jgi:hypothetical protein
VSGNSFRPGLLVRILSRLYAWATERDEARIRRENPEWWARVQAHYRQADRRAE